MIDFVNPDRKLKVSNVKESSKVSSIPKHDKNSYFAHRRHSMNEVPAGLQIRATQNKNSMRVVADNKHLARVK